MVGVADGANVYHTTALEVSQVMCVLAAVRLNTVKVGLIAHDNGVRQSVVRLLLQEANPVGLWDFDVQLIRYARRLRHAVAGNANDFPAPCYDLLIDDGLRHQRENGKQGI